MVSPVNTSVKFFDEGMPGAPALNGTASALISLLDACLVNGFSSRACTIVVASGVATVTVSSDVKNLNLPKTVQLIAGVTGGPTGWADLNGEQKITLATATTLKFACPTVSDGSASGTITVKHAPLGWAKVYSGTNKAAYQAVDPSGKRMFLRVDDSATAYAVVRGYLTMSDVDTGTNPFPPAATADSATVWQKTYTATATTVPWNLHGDQAVIYFSPAPYRFSNVNYNGQTTYCFGDILPYLSTDAYSTVLWAASGNQASWTSGNVFTTGTTNTGVTYLARAYTGLGTAVIAYDGPIMGLTGSSSGSDATASVFPALVDGSLRVTPIVVTEVNVPYTSAARYRGEMAGLKYVCHQGTLASSYPRGSTVDIGGRTYYSVPTGDWTSSALGCGLIDITGPWR